MSLGVKNVEIEPAIRDLRNRTLARLPGDVSRLVYLASSRDLNTGRYSHDGLAFHFSENVACKAMAACHAEIFNRLVYCSLQELIEELRSYISSTAERPGDVLESWRHRSEEHTSELQSQSNLVCRLLLEKKNTT